MHDYHKLFFSKLEKFRCNSDSEWPEKLPHACLSANTNFKKAIGSTPFKIMFGRDCNPVYLFRSVDTYQETESDAEDDIPCISEQNPVSLFDPPDDSNEEILKELELKRVTEKSEAHLNILMEQRRQKKIYDAKVETNR